MELNNLRWPALYIPDGVVFCEFRTRPLPRHFMHPDDLEPQLKLVKS